VGEVNAVASIRAWGEVFGKNRYPDEETVTITADCGGSNSYRIRMWKTELQRLADAARLRVRVLHYPPRTSKWNKIEHRLFSYVSINWRAKPLVSRPSSDRPDRPPQRPPLGSRSTRGVTQHLPDKDPGRRCPRQGGRILLARRTTGYGAG